MKLPRKTKKALRRWQANYILNSKELARVSKIFPYPDWKSHAVNRKAEWTLSVCGLRYSLLQRVNMYKSTQQFAMAFYNEFTKTELGKEFQYLTNNAVWSKPTSPDIILNSNNNAEYVHSPALKSNKYQCEECQGIFEYGVSHDTALAEMKENFGDIPEHHRAIVCDDCYNEIMQRINN